MSPYKQVLLTLAASGWLTCASAQTQPTVSTMPFEPRAALGGAFYRVTGEACHTVVSLTGSAAAQLPSSSTLVACLVYTRYATAALVTNMIGNAMKGSGYLLSVRNGGTPEGNWGLLSYTSSPQRICKNLVYGIREYDQQVFVGVFCLPNVGMNTKAVNYATAQIAPAQAPTAKPFQITDRTFVNAADATSDIHARNSPVSPTMDGVDWRINGKQYTISERSPVASLWKNEQPQDDSDYQNFSISSRARNESSESTYSVWIPVKSFLFKVAGCQAADARAWIEGQPAIKFVCGRDTFTLRVKNF